MAYDPNASDEQPGSRRRGPQIEMTIDGGFRRPVHRTLPITTKIGGAAILVAFMAAGIGIAALALWVAVAVIPIALGAALVAYLAFRFQIWRARGGAGPLSRM